MWLITSIVLLWSPSVMYTVKVVVHQKPCKIKTFLLATKCSIFDDHECLYCGPIRMGFMDNVMGITHRITQVSVIAEFLQL